MTTFTVFYFIIAIFGSVSYIRSIELYKYDEVKNMNIKNIIDNNMSNTKNGSIHRIYMLVIFLVLMMFINNVYTEYIYYIYNSYVIIATIVCYKSLYKFKKELNDQINKELKNK